MSASKSMQGVARVAMHGMKLDLFPEGFLLPCFECARGVFFPLVFLLDAYGSKEQNTILWGPISIATIDQSSRPATRNTICDKDTQKLNFAHKITDPIKSHKIT